MTAHFTIVLCIERDITMSDLLANAEVALVRELASKASVVVLSKEIEFRLKDICVSLTEKLLSDILALMESRISMMPNVRDARNAIDVLRRHLAYVGCDLDDALSEIDSDEDYDSDNSSDDESGSESDNDSDDSTLPRIEGDGDDNDSDKENHWEMESSSDSLMCYSDDDEASDGISVNSLDEQHKRPSRAFKVFVGCILEVNLRTGLDFPDDVLCLLETFLVRQVTMSFQCDPAW